jgi:hypothetical protein
VREGAKFEDPEALPLESDPELPEKERARGLEVLEGPDDEGEPRKDEEECHAAHHEVERSFEPRMDEEGRCGPVGGRSRKLRDVHGSILLWREENGNGVVAPFRGGKDLLRVAVMV